MKLLSNKKEGWHSFYDYMKRFYPNEHDGKKIALNEILAFRIQIYEGVYSHDFVTSLIEKHYFHNELSQEAIQDVNDSVQFATKYFDPQYQAEVSWRGILAPNVHSFLHPSEELLAKAERFARRSSQELVPQYVKNLREIVSI